MSADTRRSRILRALQSSIGPISAAALARELGVSRQVIVGDVAILRAGGAEISATPRGYVLERETGMLTRTVACVHTGEQTGHELEIMVDNGCTVRDVIVEHPIYGQLIGSLELKSRYDVSQFVARLARTEAQPLSMLTDGIHLHTLLCPDEAAFARVRAELAQEGFLFREEE